MPMRRAVLMMRQAISPRLAIRTRLNIGLEPHSAGHNEFHHPGSTKLYATGDIDPMKSFSGPRSVRNAMLLRLGRDPLIFHLQLPWRSLIARVYRRFPMALSINDTAPDFEADTTEGRIRFHDWIGDKWAVLFSHPKDFTPVCTTELGYVAKIKPEFEKRNAKIIALSVDPVDSHKGWVGDIEETQGAKINYPILADGDRKVSKLY